MSFTDVAQVLQLQGGSPLLKSGSVFSENLAVTKNVQSPVSSSMLPSLMSGGLASIMQNPMSAVTSLAGGQLSSLLSQVSGTGALPQMTGALTSMISSVSALSDTSDYLVGAQVPPLGTYGHRDLAMHYRTARLLGDDPPQSLSPVTAAAPITSMQLVSDAVAQVATLARSALTGDVDDATAAAGVATLTAQLDAVVDDSDAAIGGLRALMPTLADVGAIGAAAASAVASRSALSPYSSADDEAWDDLLQLIVQPDAYAELKTAALTEISVAPPTLGPVAPNMPIGNVALSALIVVQADGQQSVIVI